MKTKQEIGNVDTHTHTHTAAANSNGIFIIMRHVTGYNSRNSNNISISSSTGTELRES